MRIGLVAASAVMVTAIASSLPAQQSRVYSPQGSDNAPQVDLWLDQISYRPGDRIYPHFVSDRGAYVTVVRVTSDGQLAVLYPRRPQEQVRYFEGQLVDDRVPPSFSNDYLFEVNESRGIGFVFAIASFDKFDYSYFTSGGTWSRARLANDGRYGDPFEIVHRFVERTLGNNSEFSLDYVSYDVQRDGIRSRYASRYRYDSYDDFYNSCYSAFGNHYSSYCRNAYPGYFGPLIVSQPGTGTPSTPNTSTGRNLAGKRIKPVTGDPLVEGAPTGPQVQTEGRIPTANPAEAAALASERARMRRDATPTDRSPTQVDVPVYRGGSQTAAPQRTEPIQRADPTPRPQMERPVMRAEPRVEQPRMEPQRVERPQPATPPRVEVRNEPMPAAAPVQQPTARTTATPAQKDQDQN
ncbi:MAG TPA: DUF4384 domain-containing protein [Gemmatimonadaceae bacterium]|nr:DUF4384 domain-containing protein [Gemmatimonadaceae bacterium]